MHRSLILGLVLLFASAATAQDRGAAAGPDSRATLRAGVLASGMVGAGLLPCGCIEAGSCDACAVVPTDAGAFAAVENGTYAAWPADRAARRSVPLAFGASAVLPGLGQAYNRQWIKAGTAFAAEAVVFTLWTITHGRGLDAESDVKVFAHRDWDPIRYSEWLSDYADYLVDELGHTMTAPDIVAPGGIDFSQPGTWTDAQRAVATSFFNQIRAVERQAYHPETGATFSHQLPYFGEQQYYELIGKYFQFAPGWYDYPAWTDGSGGYTDAIDPEMTGPGGSKPNVSPTFLRYAREHADSQDLLRTASRLSALFVVNHLVAAIDAAVFAKLHNDRLDVSGGLAYSVDGPRPVVRASLQF